MTAPPGPPSVDGPDVSPWYEICLRGPLGPTLLQAFPRLSAHRRGEDTVLTGPLVDQSAVYGLLSELGALGLELLALTRVPPPRTFVAPGAPADTPAGATTIRRSAAALVRLAAAASPAVLAVLTLRRALTHLRRTDTR